MCIPFFRIGTSRGDLRCRFRPSFTLIELLLVMGIIATLASVVILSINPARQLGQARDAQRRSTVSQLQKALDQYLIDNNQYPSGMQEGQSLAKAICRVGVVESSCVSLDALVTNGTYLPSIPVDPLETNALITGYSLYLQNGRAQANASHMETSGWTFLVDGSAYGIQDTAADASYKLMKSFPAGKTGTARIQWQAYIQSGTYYFAWKITKNNGATTLSSGAYNTCADGSCSVHAYELFSKNVSLVAGEMIELWMVSSTSGGTPVNGNGQTLYAKELRVDYL